MTLSRFTVVPAEAAWVAFMTDGQDSSPFRDMGRRWSHFGRLRCLQDDMRLLVLGATGRTGGHILDLSLARGYVKACP
jgi:hypothetical protein